MRQWLYPSAFFDVFRLLLLKEPQLPSNYLVPPTHCSSIIHRHPPVLHY